MAAAKIDDMTEPAVHHVEQSFLTFQIIETDASKTTVTDRGFSLDAFA